MKNNKFKVGDLVMLSSQGKALTQNNHAYGGWGVVTEILENYSDFPIRTFWFGRVAYDTSGKREWIPISFKPYELKFFKKNT